MIKWINAILVSLFLSVINCTTDKSLPSGYEALKRDYKGEVVVTEAKAIGSGSYWSTPVAGNDATLLIGSYQDVNSYFLLRFTDFSDIDTADVLSAVLNLHQMSHFGEGDSFAVQIYPVNTTWTESEVKWPAIKDGYDSGNPVGSFHVQAADTLDIGVDLPASLINGWITAGDNNGLLFAFEQAPFVAEFYSTSSAGYWASLDVVYRAKAGNLDTVIVSVVHDASLLKYDTQTPENSLQQDISRLRIGNGTGYRSLVKFDLSSIPQASTIHQAYLVLHVDGRQSYTKSTGMFIAATVVAGDSIWTPGSIELDSLNLSPTGIAVSDNATFSITSASDIASLTMRVQEWLWKQRPNYGLLLYSLEEADNLSEMSFYSGLDDSTLVPSLRITYSLPSSSRFQSP